MLKTVFFSEKQLARKLGAYKERDTKKAACAEAKSIRNQFSLNSLMRNMGSKKRLTLKQMEKSQEKKERKEKGSGRSLSEKKIVGIVPPDSRSKQVVDQLKKMRVLTPYTVATRFDLRLSVARDLLEELEKQGVVKFVSGSKNLKIYKPSD
jgi:small subunit ribosomal protein S25e